MKILVKKNAVERFLLKCFSKKQYQRYKECLEYKKSKERWARHLSKSSCVPANYRFSLVTEESLRSTAEEKGGLTFKHSGSAGDVVYALATLKSIKELTGAPICLVLNLNAPANYPKGMSHPSGGVMLSANSGELFRDLLLSQPYIDKVATLENGQPFRGDVDLDAFRVLSLNLGAGHIGRWYIPITTIYPNVIDPWLEARPRLGLQNTLICTRTTRTLNRAISYRFLDQYPDVAFIGVDSEYRMLKEKISRLRHLKVANFLEMAEMIAGCKLFIGNQSLPFSLAEALKVPRLLEYNKEIPNNIPLGEGGFDFYSQPQFEYLVKRMASSSSKPLPKKVLTGAN